MKVRRNILLALTLLVLATVAYWALWKFHFSQRDIDPFAPETTYDKFVRYTFEPIEDYEWKKARRLSISEERMKIPGRWDGRFWVSGEGGSFRNVSITIKNDIITFVEASIWPELHGKSYQIQTDEESWDLFFVTELGRTKIWPPSDHERSRQGHDLLYLQAQDNGKWPGETWLMYPLVHSSNEAKKPPNRDK